MLKIGTDVLLPEAVPPLCRCDEFVHRLPRCCQIAMIGLSRKSDPTSPRSISSITLFTSFHLHDLMKFWPCLHSSIVFFKIFLCKSILCVEIQAEVFFVDLGNRLIEIFQMTDSLAGRLAFQNANIFTQHHLPFKMHINVKCTRDKASF